MLPIELFTYKQTKASFEASLNYTKMATLPTKAYAGKSKMNSAKKKMPPVEIDWTLC